MILLTTRDAAKTIRGKFKPSPAAEKAFYRQLKKVAQHAGHIVDLHADGASLRYPKEMEAELERYAKKIEPWAKAQAAKMLQTVQRSNKRAYQEKSKLIGSALKLGLVEDNVYDTALVLLNEQVRLITSIPIDAGLRAQKIAFEAVLAGTRAEVDTDTVSQLVEEMGFTTEAAVNRAMLIARTETAKANAYINQSRAQSIGSTQYRWHNSGDADVRKSHRVYQGRPIQGRIFSWDNPPTLSDGMTGHPGTFPNCRCFAEPIFSDE